MSRKVDECKPLARGGLLVVSQKKLSESGGGGGGAGGGGEDDEEEEDEKAVDYSGGLGGNLGRRSHSFTLELNLSNFRTHP